MNYSALFFITIGFFSTLLAEVTVLKQVQVVYDQSPKLRIRGSGFDVDAHKIILTLGTKGLPPLVLGKDYLVNVDEHGNGLILKLLSNRKWADLTDRVPPVALILSSVKFKGSDNNLLHEAVVVANILPLPTIKDNFEYVMNKSATNELRINGTGFIGVKKVDLYFDPPLVKEIDYEDVTPYPLTNNHVILRLRHGYNWRETPGPLNVLGVDTGGGIMTVNGRDGVVVAQVEADPDPHSTGANTQRNVNEKPNHDTSPRTADTSDFMKEWAEKKEAVYQSQQQLQALVESYEQKFQEREAALQAREQQLQEKESRVFPTSLERTNIVGFEEL